MDVTIEIMLPPRGASDFSQSANSSYSVLSIIAIYPLKTIATVGMQNTGYVHVTNVPERAGWAALTTEEIFRRINARLCKPWWQDETAQVKVRLAKRLWKGVAASIPAQAAQNLRQDRQITVTWAQLKNFIQNVKENRLLTDTDLD